MYVHQFCIEKSQYRTYNPVTVQAFICTCIMFDLEG